MSIAVAVTVTVVRLIVRLIVRILGSLAILVPFILLGTVCSVLADPVGQYPVLHFFYGLFFGVIGGLAVNAFLSFTATTSTSTDPANR